MHRGKVDPEVSELPRGNEFSRDHVNRPLVCFNCKAGVFLRSFTSKKVITIHASAKKVSSSIENI